MKKRTKRIGTVITLLCMSAIAATSGTLAWFSAVRTAYVTYSDAEIYQSQANLNVTFKNSLNSLADSTETTTTTTITLSGTNSITDISGNGINFYRPMWNCNYDAANSMKVIPMSNAGDADGHYVDFTLNFGRSPGEEDKDMHIFFGVGTALTPLDAGNQKDVDTIKALRMAVIGYDNGISETGTPQLKILYAPEAETDPIYIIEDAAGLAYGLSGYKLKDASTELKSHAFATKYTVAEAQANYPEIAVLTASATNTDVTFRFWIEGTDEHCEDAIIGGKFKITLDIYSLTE